MRKIPVRGHVRRTSDGRIVNVSAFTRTGHTAVAKPVEMLKADYSDIRNVADAQSTTGAEWASTRIVPQKQGFMKQLFKKDYHEYVDSEGNTKKILVDVSANGEGVIRVECEKNGQENILIGPYADLEDSLIGSSKGGLEKRISDLSMDLNSVNLMGCKAKGVSFGFGAILANSNFESADLEMSDLSHSDLSGTILRQANLTSSDLKCANLKNADLSDANLAGANLMGADLRGVNWKGVNLAGVYLTRNYTRDDSQNNGPTPRYDENGIPMTRYDQIDFHTAAEQMELTDKQMEFLIVSKGIEVRDNESLEIVTEEFDVEKHHVVPWAVQNWVMPEDDEAKKLQLGSLA